MKYLPAEWMQKHAVSVYSQMVTGIQLEIPQLKISAFQSQTKTVA